MELLMKTEEECGGVWGDDKSSGKPAPCWTCCCWKGKPLNPPAGSSSFLDLFTSSLSLSTYKIIMIIAEDVKSIFSGCRSISESYTGVVVS